MSISKKYYKITVLIINYNSNKQTIKLLKSLKLISNYINEILIIDNCSNEDLKINQFNKISLIKNKQIFKSCKSRN